MNAHDLRLAHGRVRVVDMGDGPPLVLIHGLGGSWQNWQANIPALAARHRVIALDLPGFGSSEPYRGAVTVERYVDTVVELLDLLGVDRATLIGNSMGGLLTIEAAARHPQRVSAVVLVSSGGIPLTSLRHRLIAIPLARVTHHVLRLRVARRAVLAVPWVRRLIAGRIVKDAGTIPGPALEAALDGLGAPGFEPAFAAAVAYDARDRAPQVACPALIVWGREDRLLHVAMGEELQRRIPHSRLEVWDGIGHCPMLEAPVRFNQLAAAFADLAADHRTEAAASGSPAP